MGFRRIHVKHSKQKPLESSPKSNRILFGVFAIGALAACISLREAPKPAEGLTAEQSKEIVTYLDELCGDTFCEGEFDYDFETFTCDDTKCSLGFSAKHYEKDVRQKASVAVKKPKQLIDPELEGPSDELFENISDALIEWEEKA